MNSFVNIVTKLLKEKNITKNQMLKDLNLSRNSFVDWNKRGTIPSAKVVSAIAEYLETTVSTLLGYPEDEEKLESFPMKLAYQITVHCTSIFEVAKYLNVSDDTVMNWIKGIDTSYGDYYNQLSDFFEILPRYWTSPGMLSPGIEPNTDEYLLILLYREYKNTGKLEGSTYGSLYHYFPGLKIYDINHLRQNLDDQEWLSLIHRLPEKKQIEFKAKMEGFLECYEESVAADESLQRTGTTNSVK